MPAAIVPLLLAAALPLLIPAAILLGARRPNGALLVNGAGAVASFVVFWLVLGGINGLYGGTPGDTVTPVLRLVVVLGGIVLLLSAWALALSAAVSARTIRWVALLVTAGYLSFFAIVISVARPDPCMVGPVPQGFFAPACAPNPLAELLVIAGYLIGPVATVTYGLGVGQAPRALPEGLLASTMTIEDADDDAPAEADGFEMRVERME